MQGKEIYSQIHCNAQLKIKLKDTTNKRKHKHLNT